MKLLLITLIVLFFGIAQFSISQTTCFEADNNFVFEGSSSARSIAQGDFNNDGEIDIIMGNSLGASSDPTLQRLVYIESTGSGNFAAPVNVLSGSRVYDVEAADLDGDGNLDVVLVNFNMNRAAVLMGNGDGTFQSPVAYTTNFGPTIVQVADINNDTYLDFAIITNSGNVDVFINDGAGVFLPSITTTLAGGSNPTDFALIDINNNGFIDAVTVNNGSGSATVLLGDGSGSFTADATYTTGIGASGIVVDYFNGDTFADIAVVNQDANNVSVLINDGSGAFSPAVNYVVDEGPLKVKTGDFDNDGLRDLAIINGISNTMSTLKGNGDGTFASHVAIYAMNSPGDLVVVDLDSDGNDDVVHSCLVGAVMPVYWGLGDGNFKLGNMVDVGNSPRDITTADFDGDGFKDFAVVNYEDNTASVYINDGTGHYSFGYDLTTGNNPSSITSGDFNGNTFQDIIVTNYTDGTASVFINTGGVFGAPTTLNVGSAPLKIRKGDFNNDSNLDLFVVNEGNEVTVLPGNGSGAFLTPIVKPTGSGSLPYDIAVGDIDGDGNDDFVVSLSGTNGVSIFKSSGIDFVSTQRSTGSSPYGVAFADLNGDARPEIIVANNGSDNIMVFSNNGTGLFGQFPTTYTSSDTKPISITTGDFNGDGETDVAITHLVSLNSTGNVVFYVGDGLGSLTFDNRHPVGSNPVSIVADDLDNNGSQDLAVVNESGNYVSIMLSMSSTPVITAGGPLTFCGSGSVTLTSSSAAEYLWSNGETTQSITVSAAGNYSVTTSAPGGGCTAVSNVLTVTHLTSPSLSFTGSDEICVGGSTSITVTGADTYQWSDALGTNATQTLSPIADKTYTVVGEMSNGCTDSFDIAITVHPLPDADFNTLNPQYCETSGAINLTPNVSGGTFSGPGVSGTIFDPSTAGVGTHSIVYTITDGNGCSNSSSQSVEVTAGGVDATFTTLASQYCEDDAIITLVPNTSGGTFSGDGVTGNTFDPEDANIGVNTITYTVSSGGCSGATSQNVTVNEMPDADFSGLAAEYCLNDGVVVLNPTTSGGTFTGPGIAGNNFNPSTALVGSHTIEYSVTVNGCTSSSTEAVEVLPLPNASFSGLAATYCVDASSVVLSPVEGGGTFSGPGISGNNFDPNAAGAGTHTITYSVTGANGCSATDSETVTVNPLPNATFTIPNSAYCDDVSSVTLTPAQSGGTFSGPGVSGSNFNPSVAGAGTHAINYEITINGCTASSTENVTVNPPPSVSFSGLNTSYCYDETNVPLTGSPSGGTFSGPGVTGNVFDPSTAGAGTHTIVYTYTDGNGCTATSSQSTTVNTIPVLSIGGLASSYCVDDASATLTGSPSGGTFSGPGITGNTFDPSAANIGSNTITYAIVSGGCSGSTSLNVLVHNLPDANFSGLAAEYCLNDGTVALSPNTSGGTFTGPGISGNNFNPSTALVGNHTIEYSVTENGCTSSSTENVEILALPDASFTGLASTYCVDASSVALSAIESGGTFSGPGISGNNFDPNAAGAGTHTITYSVTGANGCSATNSETVTVNPLPNATFTIPNSAYCDDVSSVTLTPAQSGGTFSGPGVSGSNFNPSVAGAGTHAINYEITINGCTASSTENVTVNPPPSVSFSGLNTSYCYDETNVPLTGSPSGGTFSGPGVTGNVFDPSTAGAGTHTIVYTYTDGNGCTATSPQNTTVNPLPVLSIGGLASDYCITSSSVTLTGSPSGGTFSGPGISGNTFDPSAANIGSNTITYAITSGGCSGSTSLNVLVHNLPDANFTGLAAEYCLNDGTVALSPNTSGGTFTGPGISGNNFNPSTALVGSHTIEYSVTENGCTSSSTENVEILVLPDASFTGLASTYCVDASSVVLSPVEGGGTFSGPGISGNNFDPNAAGAGTHTITYSVTGANGCSATDSETVTVNPLPNAAFTIPNSAYCEDVNTVPLTPVQSGGTFSGPGVSGSNFNPSVAGAGTHAINYEITINGCTASSTENVTVNPPPSVSFSGLNTSYCYDETNVPLTGSPSGGTFSGPGVTGNVFDPSTAGEGTHTIIYTYTDGNGCPATSSQNTTVNPLPVLSIGGLASDYCITSSSVTLTGSPSGGTFSGPGISGNTFDPGSALEGVHSITYAYTDGNGCSAVTSQNVEVNLESNASFTGLSGPYCSSDDTIIALVPVESGGVFSGNGVTGNNWSPADAVIGNNTIEYEVGSGGCVNSSSVVVEVLASPNPSFTNLDDVYCNNEPNVTLVPVESGGVFTATSGLTANVFHPQIADLGINVITYSINDSYGCSAMSTDTVEIVAVPVSTFSVIDTVFSADLTGGSYTYQWMNCKDKTPIVGETDSVLHVGLNGSYALVTSNGMCSDTSDCVIIYFASLDSYLAENSVKVYPNPNNGHFKIETNFDAKIEIINSVGQLVYLDNKIKGQTEIDLGNEIESGMYIVKLTGKNGASVYRNVVVRN